jgi:hypothetical protein
MRGFRSGQRHFRGTPEPRGRLPPQSQVYAPLQFVWWSNTRMSLGIYGFRWLCRFTLTRSATPMP